MITIIPTGRPSTLDANSSPSPLKNLVSSVLTGAKRVFTPEFGILVGAPLTLSACVLSGLKNPDIITVCGLLGFFFTLPLAIRATLIGVLHSRGYYGDLDWINGTIHGKGSVTSPDWGTYIGDFSHGEFHGNGSLIASNGTALQGEFRNNFPHGKCVLMTPSTILAGTWQNGHLWGDKSDLSSPYFLKSLLQKTKVHDQSYPISILSEYFVLEGQNKMDPVYKKINSDLADLKNDYLQNDPCCPLRILSDLNEKPSRLINFSAANHAMLMEIKPVGDRVLLTIYNSGAGLRNHPFDPATGRSQTALHLKIPKAALNQNTLQKFLDEAATVEEKYALLFKLPGVKISLPSNPVWQKEQKGPNCALEIVFAYLKNTLGEKRYHKMRIKFFEECIRAIRTSNHPEALEFLPLLQAKIENRIRRQLNRN